jgi:uncharacterized membrane protein/osmotically-inducible protein OsmY
MNVVVALTGGVGLGVALAYWLDPDRGRRRRAVAADQVVHAAHKAADAAEATARDVRNRSRGTVAAMRSRLRRDDPDDVVVAERVRARLGGVVRHPRSIEVNVADGCVTLRGPVLADEVGALIRRVAATRGVSDVDNRLDIHESPGDVPGLQGEPGRRTGGPRMAFMQEVWSPTARLIAGLAGGGLAVYGLRTSGTLGTVAGLTGLALLARGASNLELRRLIGVGGGRRAIDLRKTLTIAAPVEDVYDLWSHYENFPRFMSHVREVRRLGEDRARWTVAGPGGVPIQFETVETQREEGSVIAWKTVEGSTVAHAGVVRFEPFDAGTRIHVQMTYNPPAGLLAHGLAYLFGADPKQAMDDDLVRMKSLLEDGRTRAHGTRVTRDDALGT